MSEPIWLTKAREHIGLREIKGERHSPEILQFWRDIKRGGIKSDEAAWCAGFVGAMLERSGLQSTRFESAKSYLTWGTPLSAPALGAVVVFEREGGGHVGFVAGIEVGSGNLLVLGGNQGDEVNIRAFPRSRVAGYRWPLGQPMPGFSVPVLAAKTALSTKES